MTSLTLSRQSALALGVETVTRVPPTNPRTRGDRSRLVLLGRRPNARRR